ncbi:hypothetical protein DYB25_003699 [Aphanomyces astaci]|uniref:Uncharacterized protein n=1 Tax=Aphanomyces astaci TaxID=112090 RepID=A0A397EEV6_APHAT|nr:hypothetical protein DYB25_003699 [Aphanomyces astaci]RHY77303.1 hypothetical protein DYB38_010360 [Aphanomyces astaci]RHZ02213.1 hypothetical protein DYB26_000659 [Aphanomyces astaci]
MFQRASFRLLDEGNAHVELSPKHDSAEPPGQGKVKSILPPHLRPWLPLLVYAVTAVSTLATMTGLSGSRTNFEASTAFGVTSQAFDSWFPKTFEFKQAPSVSHCTDLSWGILAVGTLACLGLVFFPLPPVVLIHTMSIWGFVYVALIAAPDGYDYKAILVRLSTQVFIVVAAVHCWYHWAIKYTFADFASASKLIQAILWGLGYVIPFHGMLHLSFLAYIPWLNFDLGGYKYNDVSHTATYVVLVVVGLVLLATVAFLLVHLHRQSKLYRTLTGYVLLTLYCLFVYALFPSTILHLHHVMVGVSILPLTRVPKWPAFAVQAAGLGLFIQGYAAWGWPTFLDILRTCA